MILKKTLSRIYYVMKYKNLNLKSGCYIGVGSSFEGYNTIGNGTVFAGKLGFASNIADYCNFTANIGNYSSVGSRVYTLPYAHPTRDFVTTHPAFYSLLKQSGFTYVKKQKFNELMYIDSNHRIAINIGSDCWIGSNVIILGGVTIGDGAIVAAGSVVLKDVAPYSIVAGNPAKIIRYRFDGETIEYLKKLAWWDKSSEWLQKYADAFENIDTLRGLLKDGNVNGGEDDEKLIIK